MELKPWLFTVSPYEGESISHFLGRLRRANDLREIELSRMMGLEGVLDRWERFCFEPSPTGGEIEALARVCQVNAKTLIHTFYIEDIIRVFPFKPIKFNGTWICGHCYAEQPYHRIEWQYEARTCPKHGAPLTSKCPRCKTRLEIPSLWEYPRCRKCFLPFEQIIDFAQWAKNVRSISRRLNHYNKPVQLELELFEMISPSQHS